MIEVGQIWYRYNAWCYTVDLPIAFGGCATTRAILSLSEHPVEKVTARGVRLDYGKLVLHSWRKKYAYPTREDALTAFVARKRKQVSILRARLEEAEAALVAAEGKTPDSIPPNRDCFEVLA